MDGVLENENMLPLMMDMGYLAEEVLGSHEEMWYAYGIISFNFYFAFTTKRWLWI